ncbi:Putative aliphatic sulfonates transport permease protein SsuC [Pigmentiphaga humi]|uniref:Aliphatic sulfonates transport permease protein SsuC n=1 Tax=Pigmentiphaga humi TaxID=2478468 RepID=A0A3P4B1Z0_9BURK|nr:ABC transporter permease [Pigmentiphaga humi]VCU70307.1 Putative aliphatic sulfonates transport permease protein SsuC [Pigmentiphaga humi]
MQPLNSDTLVLDGAPAAAPAIVLPLVETRSGAQRLAPRKLPRGAYLLGPAVVLVLWQLASEVGWLPPQLLAPPSAALATGYELWVDGALGAHLMASAVRAYSGLVLGVVLGLVLALVSGLTRSGEAAVDGLVQVKRAVPTLALIPLAILWLGIGEAMKVTIITLAVLVPVYINTHASLRGIDLRYVELARTLGLGHGEFLKRVAFPGALPGFFTGLRLAVTTCWTSLVVLEQINTTEGVGFLMNRAREYGQTDVIVVGLIIYAGLGLVSDALVRAWERRTLAYRKALGQ